MWNVLESALAILGAVASILAAAAALALSYRRWRWSRALTWNDSLRTAKNWLEGIEGSGWKPDLVVGLGRSGGLWGGWLAGNLGSLPLAVVDDQYAETPTGVEVEFPGADSILLSLKEHHGTPLRVLLVEGATSGGHTLQQFQQRFSEKMAGWDVRVGVLYRNPASRAKVDFVGENGPEPWPEKFPWHDRDCYRPFLRDVARLPARAA